jgi:hypothetical protein
VGPWVYNCLRCFGGKTHESFLNLVLKKILLLCLNSARGTSFLLSKPNMARVKLLMLPSAVLIIMNCENCGAEYMSPIALHGHFCMVWTWLL